MSWYVMKPYTAACKNNPKLVGRPPSATLRAIAYCAGTTLLITLSTNVYVKGDEITKNKRAAVNEARTFLSDVNAILYFYLEKTLPTTFKL